MSEESYPKFGKIPRLHREVIITEKIDGTNGLIEILETQSGDLSEVENPLLWNPYNGGPDHLIRAGSRKRWITPEEDNHGFARWVFDNAKTLVADLGPGLHYGEWWGKGIGKRYSQVMEGKKFSLFNTGRWADASFTTPDLHVVPVLARGNALELNTNLEKVLAELKNNGSVVAPGAKAEGIIIYHVAANSMFKVTVEKDEEYKGANRV
jgi:hypothetical protein